MVILGSKIQPSKKLEKINEIFLRSFGVSYSTIIEIGENGNVLKASNVSSEMISSIININKENIFIESLNNNTPKCIIVKPNLWITEITGCIFAWQVILAYNYAVLFEGADDGGV